MRMELFERQGKQSGIQAVDKSQSQELTKDFSLSAWAAHASKEIVLAMHTRRWFVIPRKIYPGIALLTLCLWPQISSAQLPEQLPKLNYEISPDFFQLPLEEHFVEPAGVAVNSKGHI